MKTRYIIALIACLTIGKASAQKTDLRQEALKGIELDYKATSSSGTNCEVFSDLTYWNFFAVRYRGWNGGNGASSTTMPDGSTLWAFRDSYFGLVSENRERKRKRNNETHNAAIMQTGEETEDDFQTLNTYQGTSLADLETYYKGLDWIEPADDGTIFRPEDATLIKYDGEPIVQVLLSGYRDGERTETSVAEFTVTDGHQLQLKDIHRNITYSKVNYGRSMLEADGRVYLYGEVPRTNTNGNILVVARTYSTDLTSRWEYYIKNADGQWQWQETTPTDDELKRSAIATGIHSSSPAAFAYNDRYFLCFFDSGSIWIAQSMTPYGPFGARRMLYTIPEEQQEAALLAVHPQLSRMGELTLSYCMQPTAVTYYRKANTGKALPINVSGPDRSYYSWGSADLNQVHFLRAIGWQSIFNIPNVGPLPDSNKETYLATGIYDVRPTSETQHPAPLYDLQGRQLDSEPGHGIFIQNGQKIIK